jgi:predicted metal-dependent hydrolase
VRESSRARTLRVLVGARIEGGIEIVVPRRVPEAQVDRFIADHRDWIDDALSKHRRRESQLGLREQGALWILGERYRLVRVRGERSHASFGRLNGELCVGIAGPAERFGQALERFLRAQARTTALELITPEEDSLGVKASKLRIGDQRTCWGSASSNDTISLNWRLVLAPREIFDYVVVHELCHLRHRDHSRRFWGLLEQRRPGFKAQERWLTEHGAELRAWKPEDVLGAG